MGPDYGGRLDVVSPVLEGSRPRPLRSRHPSFVALLLRDPISLASECNCGARGRALRISWHASIGHGQNGRVIASNLPYMPHTFFAHKNFLIQIDVIRGYSTRVEIFVSKGLGALRPTQEASGMSEYLRYAQGSFLGIR